MVIPQHGLEDINPCNDIFIPCSPCKYRCYVRSMSNAHYLYSSIDKAGHKTIIFDKFIANDEKIVKIISQQALKNVYIYNTITTGYFYSYVKNIFSTSD